MNANELADRLDTFSYYCMDDKDKIFTDSATMLRQQQAEIEKLKAEIDRLVNHSRTWTPFD